METSDVLLVALVVLVPAALMWSVFIARSGRPTSTPKPRLGIPQALRPASPDEVLEGPRLERLLTWGLVATLVSAVFIPAYWLPETSRQDAFQERFDEEAVERGHLIFSAPPLLEEGIDPVEFKATEEAIALGQNCAFCHGGNAGGGPVPGGFVDPISNAQVNYNAPPLDNVFTRWDEDVVKFTIERGRPGTPMPAWAVEFGGPMTEQAVTDVIAYLKTLEGNQAPPELAKEVCGPTDPNTNKCSTGQEIFEARCALCHGPLGQGKDDDSLWFQGAALWEGKILHLSGDQHVTTVTNGRRFAFMPPFGEAPSQGIPLPPYPLTKEQIEAVVAYERTL